jgi:hypothetical protein
VTYHDRSEGQSSSRLSVPGDGVDPGKDNSQRDGEDGRGKDHIPHPILPFELLEDAARDNTSNHATDSIDEYDSC